MASGMTFSGMAMSGMMSFRCMMSRGCMLMTSSWSRSVSGSMT